jgi:hypothetical protein
MEMSDPLESSVNMIMMMMMMMRRRRRRMHI